MDFIPQILLDYLPNIVPLLTMVVGLLYFSVPKIALSHIGVLPVDKHPEAFGEGRSTFSGFLILLGALCFFTKEPNLIFVLGVAWGIAAFGKLLQIFADGARERSVFIRFTLALFFCAVCIAYAGLPNYSTNLDVALVNIVASVSAFLTLCLGLLCLFAPSFAGSLMRLRSNVVVEGAIGEIRGNVAGFYIATSLAVLFIGGTHSIVALGLCWLMTAFGRMVSMLSDKANNLYNWVSLLVELLLAALPLSVVFGVL